jgi:hypothetical protein
MRHAGRSGVALVGPLTQLELSSAGTRSVCQSGVLRRSGTYAKSMRAAANRAVARPTRRKSAIFMPTKSAPHTGHWLRLSTSHADAHYIERAPMLRPLRTAAFPNFARTLSTARSTAARRAVLSSNRRGGSHSAAGQIWLRPTPSRR